MLFKEAVIIIAVCSTITILFVVLIITRRYSRPSTPLPSIQPLAHHRVQLVEQSQLQNSSTFLLQHPIAPSTTSKPLPLPPPMSSAPPSRHLPPSNFEHGSHSATSCSTKNSHGGRPGHGVPHSPLSRIEIILPVPLALNVRRGVATKSTIADRWASAGTAQH